MKQLAMVGCFVFFTGCVVFEPTAPEDNEVARVGTYSLTLAEVLESIQITPERDSAAQVKMFINNWVKNHVILQKAEMELFPDEKKFSKQLEDYRYSLIRYAYEQKYIKDNLDTNVSRQQIADFYKENQKNFELKENIARVRYLYLDKKKSALKTRAKALLISTSKNGKAEFNRFIQKNKLKGYWDDSTWVFFADVLNLVPIEIYNTEDFLRKHSYYETTDAQKTNLIYIKEHKIMSRLLLYKVQRQQNKFLEILRCAGH